MPAHPSPARLTVCVGATGHRPNHLADADGAVLRARLREVLDGVRRAALAALAEAGDAYRDEPPILRVISPLAEGADCLIAEEAIALGFELQCPLPFDRAEYLRDFATAEARAGFEALLAKATAVLELDGSRDPDAVNEAYEGAGRVTLVQSDLLIAIWDGEPGRGRGGTRQIIDEALTLDMPVIWVRSQAPHEACALTRDRIGNRHAQPLEQAYSRLRTILLPPPPVPPEEPRSAPVDGRAQYFAETQPRWTLVGWVWSDFRDVVTRLRLRPPVLRVPDFQAATAAAWAREWAQSPALPERVYRHIDRTVRPHYAWADGLAVYYADLYRSSFVINYLVGVVIVLLALLANAVGVGGRDDSRELVSNVGTVVAVLLVLAVIRLATRRRWQDRWIDYRLLAELLRQVRFLMLLGRLPRFSRPPAHVLYGDARGTWMAWHVRAVAREAGMISARFDDAYREACRAVLLDALIAGRGPVAGQLTYHRQTGALFERLDRRLRRGRLLLYQGTLLNTVAVTLSALAILPYSRPLALVVGAVFPALSGALSGIRSQGGTDRLVKRSTAMALHLEQIKAELESAAAVASAVALGRIAESAADAMVAEVLDWRMVFLSTRMDLPS